MRPKPIAGALAVLAGATVATGFGASPLGAQTVSGRVLDTSTGQPVVMAGVHLFDTDRDQVSMAIADSLGRYLLEVPESGEYFLFVQRLGYFETVSPLLEISTARSYGVDLELRPEPIALDPFAVTVRNEEAYRWWRLRFGINPAEVFGFRMYQGARLEEAKLRGADNTETLRFLYIPVSHGQRVCVATTPRPARGGFHRTAEASAVFEDFRPDGAGVLSESGGGGSPSLADLDDSCGSLYVDDLRVPNEHIESIDMADIAVVMTLPGAVFLYNRDFDWSFRPR